MLKGFDRKLILELQENGKATNLELAERLGAHVSVVAARMAALQENEILQVRALPNPFKLGYLAHAFIAVTAESKAIENICSSMKEEFSINMIVTAFGRYDILAIAYSPTWVELFEMVSSRLSTIDGILNIELLLINEIRKREYGFEVNDTKPVKIDEIDEKIIEKLTDNGRLRYLHLAREIGISPPTCSRRIARLLAEKAIVIRGVPNPSKIGFVANAFMLIKVKNGKLDELCDKLASYEDIFFIMTLINKYDILIGFNADTPENLYQLKNEILRMECIIGNETIVRAGIIKRYYGGFLK